MAKMLVISRVTGKKYFGTLTTKGAADFSTSLPFADDFVVVGDPTLAGPAVIIHADNAEIFSDTGENCQEDGVISLP